ncbi:hypothetical protein [Streptomyces wedmorensis]|uniref:hypothetical protein n=1 Tax=Streptomyces wedmorensis TaxID=43759 RepID=UPI0037B24E96
MDQRKKVLAEAIEHHRRVDAARAALERARFAAMSFERVVDLVTQGLNSKGEKNDHLMPWLDTEDWKQAFATYNEDLTTPDKLERLEELAKARKFRGVYDVLWENRVKFVSRMAIYDAAVGISAHYEGRPTRVYVHALPLKAAKVLELPVIDDHKIRKSAIPKHWGLSDWPAGDIEDILCGFFKRWRELPGAGSR